MKALLVRQFGEVSKIEIADVSDPVIDANEVLVEVRAAAVNFPDLLVIAGRYQNLPALPFSPRNREFSFPPEPEVLSPGARGCRLLFYFS